MWSKAEGAWATQTHRGSEACQSSYLNPQPVPPRIIAASRIAPATEPIMILVPLGPAGAKESIRHGTGTSHESRVWQCSINTQEDSENKLFVNVTFRVIYCCTLKPGVCVFWTVQYQGWVTVFKNKKSSHDNYNQAIKTNSGLNWVKKGSKINTKWT